MSKSTFLTTTGRIVVITFAISFGIYPALYFLVDMSAGFLSNKPDSLLNSQVWWAAFYGHIVPGGIALLIGWIQFSKTMRRKYLNTHRIIGKIYVICCLVSGVSASYLAFYAWGGWISKLGFTGLAIAWLFTTIQAYSSIKSGHLELHKKWMIRSYALTLAAVSLRLWMPILTSSGIEYITTYQIVSWLCWVPNLLASQWLINRMSTPAPAD